MKKRISSVFERLPAMLQKITWPILAQGFGAALLLAVFGQIVLTNNLGVFLGISFYTLAILLFLAILNIAGKRLPPSEEDRAIIRRYPFPFILILLSIVLLVFVLQHVDNSHIDRWVNYLILLAWIVTLLLFSIGVLFAARWRPPSLRSFGPWVKENKWEIIAVAVLFLLALFLRIYKLEQYPYPFLKDEAWVGTEALEILNGGFTNLFQGGWQVDSLLNSFPEAISIKIFGNTIFGIRFAPVLFGTFSVVFLYFLARAMFDKMTAFLAALCLLAIPPHLHFSRMGVSNITVGFWAVLVFWLTYRAIQKGRMSDYLWAGLITGLPLYSYIGSRLISALGALMLLYCVLTQKGFLRKQWRNLLVYGAILTLVVAPTLFLAHLHPETFLARFKSDNIFNNRWLISEPVNSGRSIPAALFDQFLRSTLVFVSQSAWEGFYNSPYPFLFSVAAVLFVFGLGYSLFHMRELRYLVLQVWFWSIVILGSTIYAIAPNAEKMVGGLPVAAIFCAIGLMRLVEVVKGMQIAPARLLNGLAVGIMAFASLQGAYYYLVQYQESRVFAHPNEEFETEVSLFVRTLGPDYRMYLLAAAPLHANEFPAHNYLTPDLETVDLDEVTEGSIAALPRDQGLIFAAIPERLTELQEVMRILPGGKWVEMERQPIPDQPESMLFYIYYLSPEVLAGE